ncbi:MAG: hypothetical protein AB7O52_06435 [Planctomycetota bacterium]
MVVALPRLLLGVLAMNLVGCLVPKGSIPTYDLSVVAATQYNHRGMVQVDADVVQGEMRVSLPTVDGGNLMLSTFGNLNLHDGIGDSWFPDGKSGKFTEVDLGLAYFRDLGPVAITGGVLAYVLPDGREFPNGIRGSTTELFGNVEGELLGFVPSLTLHYDGDEVDGVYVETGVRRPFELSDKLSADVAVNLGYSDKKQSDWNYGLDRAGLADLRGELKVFYAWNDTTTFMAGIAGATILDDELRDWFDLLGIESDNLWGFIGVLWTF